ncbi:MAG: VTT domain-containing protein [Actinomycetota bacterium]|nr:VTT domain-containing protein [Actinomycetota bacterium]
MRRYWLAAAVTLACFTAVFVAVEAAGLRILTDPRPAMEDGGAVAGLIGVALLAGDALLPVPSSIVMVLHGALYGAVAGAALSFAGRMGAAVFGFAIGRRGGPFLERVAGRAETERANRLLERWGALGIVLSRPAPLLAETTMVLAGASTLSWPVALGAAAVGSLPEVVVYALAGSAAASFRSTAAVFLSFLALLAVVWVVLERRVRPGYERAGSNGIDSSPRM